MMLDESVEHKKIVGVKVEVAGGWTGLGLI